MQKDYKLFAKERTQLLLQEAGYPQCPSCGSIFRDSKRIGELGLEFEVYCGDCGHTLGRQRNELRVEQSED